jgi:hypothetical protein
VDPEPDTWPAPTPRDGLLTRIESRGSRLRRRRRTSIAAGVVVLAALVALPFAAADDGDDDTSVVASEGDAAPAPPSTAGPASTRTADTATDTAGDPDGSSSSSTTSTSAAPSTTPTAAPEGPAPTGPPPTAAPVDPPPACRNSFDLRCGPLVLDPSPQNQPATAELEVVTPSPLVGEPVTVRVRVRDPDFGIECIDATAGDRAFRVYGDVVRPEAGGCGFPAIGCPVSTDGAPSGPWDPPPPTGSTDLTFDLTHTFSTAGEHTFSVAVNAFGNWTSGDLCFEGGGPYASRFRESITVLVS